MYYLNKKWHVMKDARWKISHSITSHIPVIWLLFLLLAVFFPSLFNAIKIFSFFLFCCRDCDCSTLTFLLTCSSMLLTWTQKKITKNEIIFVFYRLRNNESYIKENKRLEICWGLYWLFSYVLPLTLFFHLDFSIPIKNKRLMFFICVAVQGLKATRIQIPRHGSFTIFTFMVVYSFWHGHIKKGN